MATIKDVARLAGVGLGTASRVVSGKGSVAPATAKRVQKAIKQLNFRPSHAARSLLSGSTNTALQCLRRISICSWFSSTKPWNLNGVSVHGRSSSAMYMPNFSSLTAIRFFTL